MKNEIIYSFLATLFLLFLSCVKETKSQDQEKKVTTAKDTTSFERFSGKLQLQKNLKEGGARILVWNQKFRGHEHIEKFQIPFQGLLISQLRGGEMTTSIGDNRVERHEGDFWAVPAGDVMAIETEDDAAILQLIAIEEDSIPKQRDQDKSKPIQEKEVTAEMYQPFVTGALNRETFKVNVPSAYTVVIWDMMFAAGQVADKISLPGAVILEVRSGKGMFLIDDKPTDINIGSTLQIGEGSTFSIDNRQGTEPITARAIIIRSALQ